MKYLSNYPKQGIIVQGREDVATSLEAGAVAEESFQKIKYLLSK